MHNATSSCLIKLGPITLVLVICHFCTVPSFTFYLHSLDNCKDMKTIYPTLANTSRFIIPLLLFAIFFYFFGLSSLKKGSAQDVVAVSELKTDLSQTSGKN